MQRVFLAALVLDIQAASRIPRYLHSNTNYFFKTFGFKKNHISFSRLYDEVESKAVLIKFHFPKIVNICVNKRYASNVIKVSLSDGQQEIDEGLREGKGMRILFQNLRKNFEMSS